MDSDFVLSLKKKYGEEFFKEEVRCEYTVTEQMKKVWAVEMDLYEKFAEVCEKYNLRYFTIGGTVLGAVRHKGFIPWDDDMDVTLPREDYNKFIQVASNEFKDPYFFQSIDTDKNHYYSHIRLRNSATTAITECFCFGGSNQGIWLDVLPLDNCVPGKAETEREQIFSLVMQNSCNMRKSNPHLKPDDIAKIEKYDKFTLTPREVYCEIQRVASLHNSEQCDYISIPVTTVYSLKKMIWPTYIFSKMVFVPFENISVSIPFGYKELLEIMYGDYMQYPPIEKRGIWHSVFFDTDRPYTEVLKEKFGVQ